jgi:hypothetical protein
MRLIAMAVLRSRTLSVSLMTSTPVTRLAPSSQYIDCLRRIAQYLTSKGAKISSQDALSLCQAAAEGNLAMVSLTSYCCVFVDIVAGEAPYL